MNGNHILIIGGTSGIGYATACHLSNCGYQVTISGRNRPKDSGLSYQYIDVETEASVESCLETVKKNGLSLDGLVYSVGITTHKKIMVDFDIDVWNHIVATNLTGALLVLKYAYHLLKEAKGRVVFVNSLASRTYSQFSGIEYTVTKSALCGLVRQLAIEWAPDGILVNSVFPSMTATPMLKENVQSEILRNIEASIPLKRIASPDEIAKAIAFLIGHDNSYMTGCGLDLNGGQFLNG